jgi:hypothetical protein
LDEGGNPLPSSLPQLKTVNEHFRELKRDYIKLFGHDFNEP